jgi:pyruvate,water dikinase
MAREYGIPAVLGTGVATHRIRSGQNVRVDGDAGTVTLLDGEDEGRPAGVAPEPAASSRAGKIALAALVGVVLIAAFARWRRRKPT